MDTIDREDTSVGGITWHSSEPDGGPDVGISLCVGNDDRLWAGEISRHLFESHNGILKFGDDNGWFLIRFAPEGSSLIARFGDAVEAQEFMEWFASRIRQTA